MGAIPAMGKTVTPHEALAAMKRDVQAKALTSNVSNFRLVYTSYAQSDKTQPAIYIFNREINTSLKGVKEAGFVMLSADDATVPVLGYSDEESFCADRNLENENFRYWLDFISRRIAYVRDGNSIPTERAYLENFNTPARSEMEAVAPLCKTKWDQDAPFNDKCPLMGGKRTYTGCVATAMAQVMKYHNWPDKGQGSNSYTWNGSKLTELFGIKSYDWENMLDVYKKGGYDDTEGDAVATLMRSCGISVNMYYSTTGSGAASVYVAPALGTYFKYDKSVRFLKREYYSLSDWENIIYTSLKNDGPVIYDGQSLVGGHSFVCDGYDGNGYFHFNWGWGGASDGYFLLDVLEPAIQGIGGSQSGTGFDFDQDIIVGIRPDKEGKSEKWSAAVYAMSYPEIDTDYTYSKGEDFAADGHVFNCGPGVLAQGGQIGVAYAPVDGDEVIYAGYELENNVDIGYGFTQYPVIIPADLPDGDYVMSFAHCGPDGDWQPVLVPQYDAQAYKVQVSGNSVKFIAEDPIELVADYKEMSDFRIDGEFFVTADVTNPADRAYYGQILGLLLDTNENLVATSNRMTVDMEAGETREMNYTSVFSQFANGFTLTPGDYLFCLGTSTSQYLLTMSDPVKIHITAGSRVDDTRMDKADKTLYNLEGARVTRPEKGRIYLMPGAGKIMIK